MTMADLEGGFSKRVSAILMSSAFLLAILGWAFSLGVTYADISYIGEEVNRIRDDTKEAKETVAALTERMIKQEITSVSIDNTLKEIRDELRDARLEREEIKELMDNAEGAKRVFEHQKLNPTE